MYGWSKLYGYEVSSKGDKRFSAFVATMPDGRTIEQHYQCDVKGYDVEGVNWRLGKGNPPLRDANLWEEYLALWKSWAKSNRPLVLELEGVVECYERMLSDRFATTEVNQAHALAEVLNTMERTKIYAGIGSRETPDHVMELEWNLARKLAIQGWVLRSGGAPGSDYAFQTGCDSVRGESEIYLPWNGFNNLTTMHRNCIDSSKLPHDRESRKWAEHYHPAWGSLKDGAKTLMARNTYQIMGRALNSPVVGVVYWAPVDGRGNPKGGTSQAVRIAQSRGISCYNLYYQDVFDRLSRWVEEN